MVGAEAEGWELPLEVPNVAISAASSCMSSLISSRFVIVVSIQLVFAADNRETTMSTWKKKACLWFTAQQAWDLPKSLVITFRGTWGNTSFTCVAIFASLWSSAVKLWTLKPRRTGVTPAARQTRQALNPSRTRRLNIRWAIYVLAAVCGTLCLCLLMCSALSALVILVEIRPSSTASSWNEDTLSS